MKVTISKVITPVVIIDGQKTETSEFTRREFVDVLFLDPWASDHEKKNFFRDFVLMIGKILDQNTINLEVKADVIYTINGVGHFHQEGVSFAQEIDNYNLLDKATYEVICRSYTRGSKVHVRITAPGPNRHHQKHKYKSAKAKSLEYLHSSSGFASGNPKTSINESIYQAKLMRGLDIRKE